MRPEGRHLRFAGLRRARSPRSRPRARARHPGTRLQLAVPDHREQVAAEAAHVRRHDPEDEVRGERGVDGVAAVGQHRRARGRRQVVRGADHAVRVRPRLVQPHAHGAGRYFTLQAVGSVGSMEFNLADLFEAVADAVPDRPALIAGDRRLTYGELDDAGEPGRALSPRRRRAARPARRHLRVQPRRVGRVDARLLQGARGADQRQLPLRRRGAALPVRQRRPRRIDLRSRVRPARRFGAAGHAEAAPPRSARRRHRHHDRGSRRGRATSTRCRSPTRRATVSCPARPTTSTSSTPAARRACPRA